MKIINCLMGKKEKKKNCMKKIVLLRLFLFVGLFMPNAVMQTFANGLGDNDMFHASTTTCYDVRHGLSVYGRMPVTATVEAVPVTAQGPEGQSVVAAYDITITDCGREWQPEAGNPVMVSLSNEKFEDGKLVDVYHQGSDGPEFVATVSPKNGTITFPAHSFSVYIVTNTTEHNHLEVIFKNSYELNSNTRIADYYVKAADTLHEELLKSLIYDPGVGDILDENVFVGWTTDSAYTAKDINTALTIEGIRNELKEKLKTNFEDGDSVVYYAMILNVFSVIYLNEDLDNILFIGNVYKHCDSTSVGYTINANYTPQEGSRLSGWKPVPTQDPTIITPFDTIFHNGDSARLINDVYLYAILEYGNWLVYNENGKGATYISPDFVNRDSVTKEPTHEMIRLGYTFGGWYTDSDCTDGNEFVWGDYLDQRTVIYAKWIPNATANYSIIIWKQNLECTDYDFETVLTMNGNTGSSLSSIVMQEDTGVRIKGTQADGTSINKVYSYEGYHFNYTQINYTATDTDDIVDVSRSSIIEVFFDRTEYMLSFYVAEGTEYMYIPTTDNTGTQYGLVNGEYVQLTPDEWYYNGEPYTGYHYSPCVDDTIGQYSGTINSQYIPVNATNKYSCSQQIYSQSDIGTTGTINKIRFYYSSTTRLTAKTNVIIYLGHTPKDSFSSNNDWISVDNLTPVYTGDFNCSTGWNEFVLSTPFEYTGGNLVLMVLDNSNSNQGGGGPGGGGPGGGGPGGGGNNYRFSTFQSNSNTSLYYYGNNAWSNTESGTCIGYKNYIEFTICSSENYHEDSDGEYGFVNGEYVKLTYVWRYNDTPYTGIRFTRSDNNNYTKVKTITKTYQTNIGDYFPIVGDNGITYNADRWDPQNKTYYTNVLVYIDIMAAANVSFLISTSDASVKHMYYYVEALEDDPAEATDRPYNGTRFKLYRDIEAKYHFFTEIEDYIDLIGFNKGGDDYPPEAYNSSGQSLSQIWGSGSNAVSLYCYYTRKFLSINYFDGVYKDGNDNPIAEIDRGLLHEDSGILYQTDISSYMKGGDNYYNPDSDDEYVFEGWLQCQTAV